MSSEETLERKKRVRTAHIASASRLLSQAEFLLEDSRIDVDALALLQTNLSAMLIALEALDKVLVELVSAEELEEIGIADEYMETWTNSQNQNFKSTSHNSSSCFTASHSES